MPTHFALRIIVAAAICAVCIVAPLIISSVWPTPYIVRVGQEVPGDIDVHAYAIEPTVSAGSSFYFVLESAMGRNAELMIACSRPFSCMVDGKTAYVYEPQDAYMRLHRIPVVLSSTHAVTVALHANDTGHDAIKAAIAETSVMDRLLSETDSFYCFAYGIYGVVIVGCLTLLIRKSSERAYLLPLVLYVLVMFATSLFTLNSMPSTILYEDYSPFRVYVTLIGETAGILVVIFTPLSGNERGRSKKERAWRIRAGCICGVYLCLLLGCRALGAFSAFTLLHEPYVMIGAVVLSIAYAVKQNGSLILLATYGLARGLTIWADLPTTLDCLTLFIRIPLFATLPFIVAIFVITLAHFAEQFVRADTLNNQLKDLNATLDQRVAERTRELREANEKLLLTEQRRHAMMVNIFHDIRSPLFAIKGCLEMMPDIDPSVTRLRNISLEKTTQLRSLTTNLFNISRFEEGQIVLDPSPQDLDSLLSSAVTNYEPKASQKSLELRYNCPACMTGRVCMVAADKFWLGQLIQNLMDNAIKYTPEGGVVTVSLSIDGTDAVMAFSNTGPGIQAQDLPNIWDRYYHAGDDKTNAGLGLSIVKEIALQHGGSVYATSTPNVLTTFEVRLPTLDSSFT